MLTENFNLSIAVATLTTSILLTGWAPKFRPSWNQVTQRRRSMAFAVLLSLACAIPALVQAPTLSVRVFNDAIIIVAIGLLMQHLKTRGSVWGTGRMVTLTRMLALVMTVGICYGYRQHREILALLSLLGTSLHARFLQTEHHEFAALFNDLQSRITTLQAHQRGFPVDSLPTKNGDNQRRAS
jgi:hypothetical protein